MKEKILQLIRYHEAKEFLKRYERLLIPGALVFGVAVDFVTFRTIKIDTAFALLGIYAIIAGICIALVHASDPKDILFRPIHFRVMRLLSPLLIQFTFGALLSASLIFYWFSGALSVSWPLMVIVAILMVSNDALRHYLMRPVVQLSVFGFILFSLFSLILPYVLNSIEPWVFALSGLVSFCTFSLYVRSLARIESINTRVPQIAAITLLIYIAMGYFYAAGVIPPIPLSLREAGAYHRITRTNGGYALVGESETWIDRLIPGQTLHLTQNEGAAVFTSIFAPAELRATIVHVWNRYDEAREEWIEEDRLAFVINGGRDGGFRGYSRKSTVVPGTWRVDVQTKTGQTLGRVRFQVERVAELPELQNSLR